jgi:hypothetical protein
MSTRIARFCVLMFCAVAVSGCGCRKMRRLPLPEINASSAKSKAMEQYDTNGDGRIEGEELENAPSLEWAVEKGKRIDANEDGALTGAEIGDRIKDWLGSNTARISVICMVKKGGAPVEGATVTFDPEKFLGDKIQPSTGVTDASGSAEISIPLKNEDPYKGVAPGLYLVRITKEGADIPEKYNTQTIFGIEVAGDSEGLVGDVLFDID